MKTEIKNIPSFMISKNKKYSSAKRYRNKLHWDLLPGKHRMPLRELRDSPRTSAVDCRLARPSKEAASSPGIDRED